MSGFDNDWRCKHDNTKGCPVGGCDTECARDQGWRGGPAHDNTLTGARLIEAGAFAIWEARGDGMKGARAALRAQAEAAGVDAELLVGCGNILHDLSSDLAPVAAFLRAMAEVLRDE